MTDIASIRRGRPVKTERNALMVEALKETDRTLANIAVSFGVSVPRVHALGWELAPDVMRQRQPNHANQVRNAMCAAIGRIYFALPSPSELAASEREKNVISYMEMAIRYIRSAITSDNIEGLHGFTTVVDQGMQAMTADISDDSLIWDIDDAYVVVSKLLKARKVQALEALNDDVEAAVAALNAIGKD